MPGIRDSRRTRTATGGDGGPSPAAARPALLVLIGSFAGLPAAALLGMLGSHGGSAEPRWWRRGRDLAQAAARDAAGAAALLLIDLDKAQSEAADGVSMAEALDPGASSRLAGQWTPVREQADSAVQAYMATVAAADLDADVEEAAARQATAEFARVSDQLTGAIAAVRQFLTRAAGPLQRARNVHATVPIRVRTAESAVAAAATAVQTAQGAGFLAREASGLLERARTALRQLSAGVSVLGLRAMLDGADQAIELARESQADAESLPGRSQQINQRITAARTLLQVTQAHLESVPEQLSELRRSFVYPSFADVENAPAAATAELERARAELHRANGLATDQEQRWVDSEAAVAAAREHIDTAAAAAQSVADRLAALRAARADPEAPLRQARRVLRDAQRFLLAGPERPAPQHVSRLDALGAALDGAPTRLAARNRPDYRAYLSELAAVQEGATAVVAAVRQARAGQH